MKGGHRMSRVCVVTGKRPVSGNKRSDSLRATRRKWNVNLQKVKVVVDGKPQTIKIAEFLKDHKVPKAVVPMFGVVSMAPVGYLSYRWLKFLGQIMRAME